MAKFRVYLEAEEQIEVEATDILQAKEEAVQVAKNVGAAVDWRATYAEPTNEEN